MLTIKRIYEAPGEDDGFRAHDPERFEEFAERYRAELVRDFARDALAA